MRYRAALYSEPSIIAPGCGQPCSGSSSPRRAGPRQGCRPAKARASIRPREGAGQRRPPALRRASAAVQHGLVALDFRPHEAGQQPHLALVPVEVAITALILAERRMSRNAGAIPRTGLSRIEEGIAPPSLVVEGIRYCAAHQASRHLGYSSITFARNSRSSSRLRFLTSESCAPDFRSRARAWYGLRGGSTGTLIICAAPGCAATVTGRARRCLAFRARFMVLLLPG